MSLETANQILDTVELILQMDESDSDDDEIIYNLLECCKMAVPAPKRKKRQKWVEDWRTERQEKGSTDFLTKEMQNAEKYFGMTEVQFNRILALMQHDIKKVNTVMREAISPAEKLAATLRFLVTGESLINMNYQTRFSQSFLSVEIPKVLSAICKNLKNSYIKFPTTTEEWEAIAEDFLLKWQFPLCLGAIDGKHILFKSPRKDGYLYHKYKGNPSIVLLALVDANYRFIYIDIGSKARETDAGIFFHSKLNEVVSNAQTNFPSDKIIGKGRNLPYVIVGNDASPLQKHILKPYPCATNNKHKQMFNIRIFRARYVVEHAFGMLTNRFRILQNKINLSAEKVELIAKTCCILHNFLLDDNNLAFASESSEPTTLNSVINTVKDTNTRKGPTEYVRQGFMEYFNEEGKVDLAESML